MKDKKVAEIDVLLHDASIEDHSDDDQICDFDEDSDDRFILFEEENNYQLDKTKSDSGGGPDSDFKEVTDYYGVPQSWP